MGQVQTAHLIPPPLPHRVAFVVGLVLVVPITTITPDRDPDMLREMRWCADWNERTIETEWGWDDDLGGVVIEK